MGRKSYHWFETGMAWRHMLVARTDPTNLGHVMHPLYVQTLIRTTVPQKLPRVISIRVALFTRD